MKVHLLLLIVTLCCCCMFGMGQPQQAISSPPHQYTTETITEQITKTIYVQASFPPQQCIRETRYIPSVTVTIIQTEAREGEAPYPPLCPCTHPPLPPHMHRPDSLDSQIPEPPEPFERLEDVPLPRPPPQNIQPSKPSVNNDDGFKPWG